MLIPGSLLSLLQVWNYILTQRSARWSLGGGWVLMHQALLPAHVTQDWFLILLAIMLPVAGMVGMWSPNITTSGTFSPSSAVEPICLREWKWDIGNLRITKNAKASGWRSIQPYPPPITPSLDTICTDHMQSTNYLPWSCIQHWVLKLSAYHPLIKFNPGNQQHNAAALSRLPLDKAPYDVSCTWRHPLHVGSSGQLWSSHCCSHLVLH